MNDIFSPSRFWDYVKLYAGENKKKLLQWIAAIVGVLIFGAAIQPVLKGVYNAPLSYDPMWDREMAMFWPVLFIIICASAASTFISYDSKLKRISGLSFPVSNLEKFFTYVLIYCIGVYVIFLVGFYVADYLRVWTAPIYAAPGCVIEPMPLKYFLCFGEDYETISESGNIMINQSTYLAAMLSFMGMITLQAFFVLASSIWPKASFRKGFLAIIGITIALNVILFFSFQLVNKIYGPITVFRFKELIMHADRFITFEGFITTGYIVGIVLTLGMYILSYFRFKEMESIERW